MLHYRLLRWLFAASAILLTNFVNSQEETKITIGNKAFASNVSTLPFWLHVNQFGKVQQSNQYLNLLDICVHQSYEPETNKKIKFSWGSDIVAALGSNKSYLQLSELYSGLIIKGWELKAGIFHEPVFYSGLSTSNGNFAKSNNSRSHPRIRISNPKYKPVPFLRKWLLFRAEYEEGILNDSRFVDNTHLHHKSIYFLISPQKKWNIQVGLEHFVMWGGESKDAEIGKLPRTLENYLRYVFSQSGNEDSPDQEKLNIAGNQLGTYQLKFTKRFIENEVSFYISHPFENHKGVNLKNWKDNLIGIYFGFYNDYKLLNAVNYEFIYTKHQAINDSLYIFNSETGKVNRKSIENYFVHSLYRSGYTFHKRVMGSPLFYSVEQQVDNNNSWYAIQSTRLIGHHLGMSGYVSKHLKWKGLLTMVKHYGTHEKPYTEPEKQLSGLLEIYYNSPAFPLELGVSGALDINSAIPNKYGVQLSVTKHW